MSTTATAQLSTATVAQKDERSSGAPPLKRLKEFLAHKERPNLDPTVLSGVYGVSISTVKKVTEIVKGIDEMFRLFGFQYELKSQAWIDKQKGKSTMNQVDLQRIILACHVYDKTILSLLEYIKSEGQDSWVSLQKWKLAAFFSYYENQDIPAVPWKGDQPKGSYFKPQGLLGGPYHDFYFQLSKTEKEFFNNTVLLGLKKGAPRVRKAMLDEAALKSFKALTDEPRTYPPKVVWVPNLEEGGLDEYEINDELLESEVRRTVRELFRGKCKNLSNYYKPYFPSSSANMEHGRAQGGSIGSFYAEFRSYVIQYMQEEPQHAHRRQDKTKPNVYEVEVPRLLFGQHDSKIDFGQKQVHYTNLRSSHYGALGEVENEFNETRFKMGTEVPLPGAAITMDVTELDSCWRREFFTWFEKAWYTTGPQDDNRSSIVALAEPLKVRTITKNLPSTQNSNKPIQKLMHTILRQTRVCKLIGAPLDEEFINELFKDLPKDNEIVSGDYKAATDNIRSKYSYIVGDEIFKIFAEESEIESDFPQKFLIKAREIFINSLIHHWFQNPEKGGPRKLQTNGQLMGEITSFPVLCIINAAVCRLSKELAEKKMYKLIPETKRGILFNCAINGDDCGFDGPKGRIRPIWEAVSAQVGLETSIGKTYFSRNMCTINSRIFRRDDDHADWKMSHFINFGLLYGIKKSVVIREEDEDDPKKTELQKKSGKQVDDKIPVHKMGQFLRDLKKTTPEKLWKKVKSRFIYYNMDRLQKTKLSWYLPEWCGGLGFPDDGELDEHSRKLAHIIKLRFKELKPVSMTDAPDWLMHQLVMKELPDVESVYHKRFEVDGHSFDTEDCWNVAYSYATYSLLYSKEFKELDGASNEYKSVKLAMRHNEKVLLKAQKLLSGEMKHITPMIDEDMLSEAKKQYPACLISKNPMFSGRRSAFQNHEKDMDPKEVIPA